MTPAVQGLSYDLCLERAITPSLCSQIVGCHMLHYIKLGIEVSKYVWVEYKELNKPDKMSILH